MASAAPRRSAARVPSKLRVHRLPEPKVTERGVLYRRGGQRYLLAWARVAQAFAAEVGEPDGPGVTLFDLVLQGRGAECVVCRLDVAPGEKAERVARAVQLAVGVDLCDPGVRALAAAGGAPRVPDADTFGQRVLESIRFETGSFESGSLETGALD
jgi:hypothetical protein